MHLLINEFAQTIAENYTKLALINNADATAPRAVGKWSPKEIIGHLIDSAANNHHRVREAHGEQRRGQVEARQFAALRVGAQYQRAGQRCGRPAS